MEGRHRPVPVAFGFSPLGLLQTLLLRDELDLGGELYNDFGLGLGISPRIDRIAAGPLEGRGGDGAIELRMPLLPAPGSEKSMEGAAPLGMVVLPPALPRPLAASSGN